jgi:hypothetical protein
MSYRPRIMSPWQLLSTTKRPVERPAESFVIENDQWNLGPAAARVTTCDGWACIELDGTLTAQAYERLHLLIAHFARDARLDGYTLTLGRRVLLACTNISAVEAAMRGSPAAGIVPGIIRVPSEKLQWARVHCSLMGVQGFSLVAMAIPEPVKALEIASPSLLPRAAPSVRQSRHRSPRSAAAQSATRPLLRRGPAGSPPA